jgi:hypothetical protein
VCAHIQTHVQGYLVTLSGSHTTQHQMTVLTDE